ncbi:hypothetical protein K466DRAFT_479023 [Polyporus arcularius HHB13444]|uniref:Coenzyme Q-binding protein COQ10 START domain-containing protein n=1 Tax=Polyporus arcularius HHB13444 TaxID=1314778 RepID=A0A5C3PU05_9APHY|nr:hypothetical protein K466DRAFT_479023 [Polyporus arcularius HHB13444]
MSSNAKSNLPPPSRAGVVIFYVTSDIDAPIEKVWVALTDFEKYPEWTIFVSDKAKNKLEDQMPTKGKYVYEETHMPPTMDDTVQRGSTVEEIIHFDDVTHRLAWRGVWPSWFLQDERWQVLSTTEDGRTLYESREVFGGIGAYLIKWFYHSKLMECFVTNAEALKSRCERQ